MTHYRINSLDASADGMERLRYQREFILLAYPEAGTTPAELLAEWLADMDSRDAGEADPGAMAEAVNDWAAENTAGLLAELRERAAAMAREPDDGEPWPPFRLYVEELD